MAAFRDRVRDFVSAHSDAPAVWQHPLFRAAAPVVDTLDAAVRRARGLGHLPDYSMRAHATGPVGQFGGRLFVTSGQGTAAQIRDLTALRASDDVLEIGCSVGRIALALSGFLEPGRYTGIDVDRRAIGVCLQNPKLDGFRFEVADVFSSVYNAGGQTKSASYVFPFADASFDVIFLTSVFTHMLPDDIAQYARESRRMLRPGGRFLFSAFVIEHREVGFAPIEQDGYRLRSAEFPERTVAYHIAQLDELMAGAGLVRNTDPGLGVWGPPAVGETRGAFDQDLLVYLPAPG